MLKSGVKKGNENALQSFAFDEAEDSIPQQRRE